MCRACTITKEERLVLTELVCENCDLIKRIENFPALESLEVSDCNKLREISLRNVKTLSITNNKKIYISIDCPNVLSMMLTNVDTSFHMTPNLDLLKVFIAYKCYIHYLPRFAPNLKILKCVDCSIKIGYTSELRIIPSYQNLTHLDLSYTELKNKCRGCITQDEEDENERERHTCEYDMITPSLPKLESFVTTFENRTMELSKKFENLTIKKSSVSKDIDIYCEIQYFESLKTVVFEEKVLSFTTREFFDYLVGESVFEFSNDVDVKEDHVSLEVNPYIENYDDFFHMMFNTFEDSKK